MRFKVPLFLTLIGLAGGCSATAPEEEIRQRLAAAQAAAEDRDAGYFADLLGAEYRDARGQDRAELLRLLRGYFLANQRIAVFSRVDEVRLERGDAARVVVHAGLLGQRRGAEFIDGLRADVYRFDLELVRTDGDWRIIGARWEPALGD